MTIQFEPALRPLHEENFLLPIHPFLNLEKNDLYCTEKAYLSVVL